MSERDVVHVRDQDEAEAVRDVIAAWKARAEAAEAENERLRYSMSDRAALRHELAEQALAEVARLREQTLVFFDVTSTGEGAPTGTWPADQPMPPPSIHVMGAPEAVAGIRAFIAQAREWEAEVARLADALAASRRREERARELLRRIVADDRAFGDHASRCERSPCPHCHGFAERQQELINEAAAFLSESEEGAR